MRLRRSAVPAMGALCALAMGWNSAAYGGIAVVDQSRLVHIDAALNPPVPNGAAPYSQTVTASAFAPFNQSISNSIPTAAITSASQTSTLTLAADASTLNLTASGEAVGNDGSEANSGVASVYYVVFTLDAPATYTLVEQQQDTIEKSPPAEIDLPNQGARLLPGTVAALFPFNPTAFVFPSQSLTPNLQELPINERGTTQTLTGTLAAGTYTLEGGAFGQPYDAAAGETYSVNFTLTSNSNGSGNPISAPLPAGGWMGLSMIGLLTGAYAIRRRRVEA